MLRTRKAKPYVPLEREVQRSGIKLLTGLGWQVERRNTGMFRLQYKGKTRFVRASKPGMADLFGRLPDGRSFELEIKRPGKRPTAKQLAWLKSQNGPHCCAFWVDSTCVLEKVARHLMNVGTIFYDSESGVDEDYYWLT
jgi:hypothetical protein